MNCEICFFHRCSYKNSCCDKLVYNSSVVFMMFFRCFYLKNVALNFVLLVLKSCCYSAQPIHGDLQQLSLTLSVRSQSLGQLLLLFLCNFCTFFAGLMYSLYRHPRNFKFKQKCQQNGLCFQTIFLFLMTRIQSKSKMLGTTNLIVEVERLTL